MLFTLWLSFRIALPSENTTPFTKSLILSQIRNFKHFIGLVRAFLRFHL